VELEVAAVVDLAPLQLGVVRGEPVGSVVGVVDGDILAVGRRRRDSGSGEFDTETSGASGRGIVGVVQPDEVRHPVGVAVSGDNDVVSDVVLCQVLQSTVTVGLVAIPSIIVERVDVAVCGAFVDLAEDGLAADDTPCSTTFSGRAQCVVEPVLLAGTHQTTARIVGDRVDIVRVPVKIGDRTIVLAGIEHDKIEERSNREATPDTKVVVHLDLADRHPSKPSQHNQLASDCTIDNSLEVGANSVHLALVNRHTTILHKGRLGVVELGGAIAVCVVRHLHLWLASLLLEAVLSGWLTSWSSQTGIHGKV
jgi:hypothetical protein